MNMKRILTCGTYDLFHKGHENIIDYLKSQGEVYVGLSTNDFAMCKGQDIKQDYQTRKLKLLEQGVKEVYAEFSMRTKEELVLALSIDKFIIGDDWKGHFDYLDCDVEYFPRTPGISSTQIRREMNLNL